nr:MAG TPA: hypothetical protein [Caudoviricetes sp.]
MHTGKSRGKEEGKRGVLGGRLGRVLGALGTLHHGAYLYVGTHAGTRTKEQRCTLT